MLQMDDLLQLAGEEPLEGFGWGEAVCNELNSYLSKERQIKGTHTGNQTLAVIRTLPVHAVARIGLLFIDPRTGDIQYKDATHHEEHALINQAVKISKRRRQQTDEEDEAEYSERPRSERDKDVHSKIMMLIATAVVAIAFMLTFNVTNSDSKNGREVKSSTLEVALKVLGEIFTSTAETAPVEPGRNGNSGRSTNGRYRDNNSYRDDNRYQDPEYSNADQESAASRRPPRDEEYQPEYGN